MSFGSTSWAADITWLGATGSWDDPSQWSGGEVPGTNGHAIINGGTVTADGPVKIDGLTLTGGTLTGSGDVLISGAVEWLDGAFRGAGMVVIESGAVAHWSRMADKRIASPMDNAGTVNWDEGKFVVESAEFNNLGEFNVAHDGQVQHGGRTPAFNNQMKQPDDVEQDQRRDGEFSQRAAQQHGSDQCRRDYFSQ